MLGPLSVRAATPALALAGALVLGGCAGLDASWSSDAAAPQPATTSAAPPSVGTGTPSPSVSSAAPSASATTASSPAPTMSQSASSPAPSPTTSAPPKPSPSTTKAPKPAPKPSAKTSAKPSASPSPTAKPRTTLRLGDRGPKVLATQQRLSELGYWLGTPDGHFGSLTQQAVYALQKAAGLSRDGSVGPKTAKALADGVRPRATLSGNGVEIVLDRQLLLVVRGGTVKTILNTSTGNRERYTSTSGNPAVAITPKGTFKVYRGVDGPLTNSLGELWRPRFFHKGIAVHGSPNIPPWPASHGCARLSNAAINMIWDKNLMPIGSTVVVR
jgi:peptidoglycan hydrolase-like protein with peptidoglycan-binding domain